MTNCAAHSEMELTSDTLDMDGDFENLNEQLYRDGMTDGLPVVPPTHSRVRAMLAEIDRGPDNRVAVIPLKYGNSTVEKIAINAVMAGADPTYLPIIIAAIKAMAEDESTFMASMQRHILLLP